MGKLTRGIIASLAVAVGAALLMAGSGPVPQDQEQLDKRLKDLEAARTALEKRLADMEKGSQDSLNRIKELEGARGALEKRLAEGEKGSKESAGSVKELEAARSALEKRVGEGEKAAQEGLARLKEESASRIKELQAAATSLEKRLAEGDKGRQDLLKMVAELEARREKASQESGTRIKELQAAEASLEKRLGEADKGRQELQASVRELQAARAAAEKRLAEAERGGQESANRLRELQSDQRSTERRLEKASQETEGRMKDLLGALAGVEKRLAESERESRGLAGRLQDSSDASERERQDRLRLRAEIQRVKIALRATNGAGLSDKSQAMAPGPVEEHYASLGIVYEFLRNPAGEGIRILRIPLGTFAHESDLNHGDAVVRVNGVPVRGTGVRAPRTALEKWWEQPQDIPNYVINHLPGEKVEVEFVRDGVHEQIQLRLACTRCGKSCAFYGEAGRR